MNTEDPKDPAESPNAVPETAPEDEAADGAVLVAAEPDEFGIDALIVGEESGAMPGTLVVDVEGYEGPLDVLLALSRAQKVDITRISILALAEQFLKFIEEAKSLQLELAADYLVMAAWLAYLKSRLLLPTEDNEDEPSGEELAARLAFQLQRLQAMRNVAAKLFARDRLGRDVFARGAPEGIRIVRKSEYSASLYELLKAYSDGRIRGADVEYKVIKPIVLAIEDARRRLEAILGRIPDWSLLSEYLPTGVAAHRLFGLDPDEAGATDGKIVDRMRRSAKASTFTAGLELARDGFLEIRQTGRFEPIYIRKRKAGEPR